MRWIVTDDIYAETWRRLLEFSNLELTTDEIVRRHGPPTSKSDRENYAKQATQARVCVLQEKEYFDAAKSSSLFTSPNHSYYGAVATASLMMLILGDGTRSLDYLRTDNRNNHHGLDFTTGSSAKTASTGIALVQQSSAAILRYGHFSNWYRTLPSRGSVSAFVHKSHGTTKSVNMQTVGGYDVPKFDAIAGTKRTLLELLKYLPDLDSDLQRFGISAVRSRSTHEVAYEADGLTKHTWRLHGCRSTDERDALLERFAVIPRFADALTCQGMENTTGGIVSLNFKLPDEIGFSWPTSRDTMNHDTISYAEAVETHEIVDLYLVAYQLSMLSRYFPDIWISCMESQCRAAKLIERAIEIITKKLPVLALSMLSVEETVISTHRAPWKD